MMGAMGSVAPAVASLLVACSFQGWSECTETDRSDISGDRERVNGCQFH